MTLYLMQSRAFVQIGLTEFIYLYITSTIMDHFCKWQRFKICSLSLDAKDYTRIKVCKNLVLYVHSGGRFRCPSTVRLIFTDNSV